MWDLGNKVMSMRKGNKHNTRILRFPNEGSEPEVVPYSCVLCGAILGLRAKVLVLEEKMNCLPPGWTESIPDDSKPGHGWPRLSPHW